MYLPPQKFEFHIIDFLLHYSITLKKRPWFSDKRPLLLISVNSIVEPFTFCTHSLYLLLHLFSYNAESLSSNVVFYFEPLCFFLIFLFSSKMFPKSKSQLSFFHFLSNHFFHRGSFSVFGRLLAPTIYSTAQLSKISNISFLKHTIDLVHSTLHIYFRNPR